MLPAALCIILHILLVTHQPYPFPIKNVLPFHASKFQNRNFIAERLTASLARQLFKSTQKEQKYWLKKESLNAQSKRNNIP